jgi:beta-galactosidase
MTDYRSLLEIGGNPTWKMPHLTGLNKLPPHATIFPFPSPQKALRQERGDSPWFRSLNGTWDFTILARPELVSDELINQVSWKSIRVPGEWTMQGYGHPHYTNVVMPFPNLPPDVPQENPTGIYHRYFDIPQNWSGRRIVLHFGGCEGALYVYLNNQPIGISKDARTPAEFDITHLINFSQPNELFVAVIQWSDASFLEDQDHWWQAGLHREVYLYSTGSPHIQDIFAIGELSEDFHNGVLKASINVGFPGERFTDIEVQLQLYDPDISLIANRAEPLNFDTLTAEWLAPSAVSNQLNFALEVANPMLWSAETPYIYTLVATVNSPQGSESNRCTVGFRKIEISDRKLLVNGKRVMIKGVNYHDHDDKMGKTIPPELMKKDLYLMKQFNINAIRTSHYPKDPEFYNLCDRLGFYVIDEANIEAHAFYQDLCHDPRYTNAFIERVQAMVERDKNHPSIILWSLGNESGYGPNHDAAAGYVRHADPTRPLHYEPALGNYRSGSESKGGQRVSDVVCPMYPDIENIIAWSKKDDGNRPMIMCEFSHCMGNSNGSLADYWHALEKYPGLQGGFLWEWIDHGILQTSPEGKTFWAYGGDFADEPNDANFCIDGIVWPDRTPHPALYEFMYLAQPVKVQLVNIKQGKFRITNKQDFISLSWLRVIWELSHDGSIIQSGELPELRIPPGKSSIVNLPLITPQLPGEYYLNFRFYQCDATSWAPAGHLVAWEQIKLYQLSKKTHINSPVINASINLDVQDNSHSISFSVNGVTAVFDNESGQLIEFGRDENFIRRGPLLHLWRAPTDNDGIKLLSERMIESLKVLSLWKSLGLPDLQIKLKSIRLVKKTGHLPKIIIQHIASGRENWEDFSHWQSYTMLPSGLLKVKNRIELGSGIIDLPRVGINLSLNPGFESITWYGKGPWENYADRQASAIIGQYQSTVSGEYVPYIMPQEHGHHVDVRWLILADNKGNRLKVAGFPTFEFNTSHFTDNDLYSACHTSDLSARPETYLSIDTAMRGLGTASCGSDTLDPYRLLKSRYDFTYSLEVFTNQPNAK